MRRIRVARRPTWGLVAAGVIALLLGVAVLFIADDRDDDETATGNTAPEITFEFFDGSSERLADLRGRPVVLNFWASWCPPCIGEMPDFGEVHRKLGDQVEFIGVNMQEVDLDAALDLVERTNVEYRLAHDRDGAIYNQFGGIAMPTTVFISAEGEIEQVHSGAIFADDLTEIIETELLE